VFRGGQGEVGITPLELKVKRGTPSFDVLLRMDGFKSIKTEVTTEQTKELTVGLAKEEVPAPPPPATAPVVEEEPAPVPQPVSKHAAAKTPVAKASKSSSKSSNKKGKPAGKSGVPEGDGIDLMQPSFLK
jgi:hypothetical protein